MRILIGHNRYQQPGGEDAVVGAETSLLRENGHDVYLYERHNDEIARLNTSQKFSFFTQLDWAKQSYDDIRRIIKEFKPDVAHFHNIFYLLSPSVYFACQEEGIPVVQSLHNFRLLCTNGLFFRNGKPCEECTSKSLWHGVKHRCYQNSFVSTAALAKMLTHHWKKGTWKDKIDAYILASEFGRQKYVQAGIDAEKIFVKPHFVSSVAEGEGQGYVLCAGRLSQEKGVQTLLDAWIDIKYPLHICGDGPLRAELEERKRIRGLDFVSFKGRVSDEEYQDQIKGASMVIIPSACYENFPIVLAEAYSYGVPVIASRLGSLEELVDEGKTGSLFNHGQSDDLREKVMQLINNDSARISMGKHARSVYENKFSPEANYQRLMEIYQKVLESRHVVI